jgi:hypothetical protein
MYINSYYTKFKGFVCGLPARLELHLFNRIALELDFNIYCFSRNFLVLWT